MKSMYLLIIIHLVKNASILDQYDLLNYPTVTSQSKLYSHQLSHFSLC